MTGFYDAQVRQQLRETREQLSVAQRTIEDQEREALKTAALLRLAEGKLAAIRALHWPIVGLGYLPTGEYDEGTACTSCGTHDEFATWWPCGTITALDRSVDGPS